MLASTEDLEEAGNKTYQNAHFGKVLGEGFSFSGFERDCLYWQDGKGHYVDLSGLSGVDSDTDGRGSAFVDLDNDGDLDVLMTAFQRKAHHLFRNNVGQDSGWLRISLKGTVSGTDAFGSVVRVRTSSGVQTKMKAGGTGYVSTSDPRLLFGLGGNAGVDSIEVTWPNGNLEVFEGADANTSVLLVEGSGATRPVEETRFTLPDPIAERDATLSKLALRPGDPFPNLSLTGPDGEQTSFADARTAGRRTLVNLWATYCVPCRAEMPELQALAPDFASAGVDIVGISLDMGDEKRKVARFLERLGIHYPNFSADETLFPRIFAGEEIFIPVSFLVDADGAILDVVTGWSNESEEKIRSLLR